MRVLKERLVWLGFAAALFVCGTLFYACSVPHSPAAAGEAIDSEGAESGPIPPGKGRLTVVLSAGNPGESRSVLSDDIIKTLKYRLTFTGPGEPIIKDDVQSGNISLLLANGNWAIEVEAFEPNDTPVGTGGGAVTVREGRHESVTISMFADPVYENGLYKIYIHNETELRRIGTDFAIDGTIEFYLENSIELTDWTPIGDDGEPFKAVFDGNGYAVTIHSFSEDALDAPYIGFLGLVEDGEIKNLSIRYELDGPVNSTNSGALADIYIGGAAGYGLRAKFDRVNVNGSLIVTNTVTTNDLYAGGITGSNYNGTITGCHVDGTVKVNSSNGGVYAGGIAGEMQASGSPMPVITLSSFTGTLAAVSDAASPSDVYAGGIFGQAYSGEITGSYAAGSVSAESSAGGTVYAGGIAGKSSISRSVSGSEGIENCYAYTAVTAKSSTGIANAGGIVGDGYSAYIAKCYAAGSVKGEGPTVYAGGIAAIGGNSHKFENCMVLLTILDGGASADVHTAFAYWSPASGTSTGSKVWEDIAITRGGSQYTKTGSPLLSTLLLDPNKDIGGIPAFTPAALFKGQVNQATYTAAGWTFGTNPEDWKWLADYDYPVLAWQTALDLNDVPDDIVIVWP